MLLRVLNFSIPLVSVDVKNTAARVIDVSSDIPDAVHF